MSIIAYHLEKNFKWILNDLTNKVKSRNFCWLKMLFVLLLSVDDWYMYITVVLWDALFSLWQQLGNVELCNRTDMSMWWNTSRTRINLWMSLENGLRSIWHVHVWTDEAKCLQCEVLICAYNTIVEEYRKRIEKNFHNMNYFYGRKFDSNFLRYIILICY